MVKMLVGQGAAVEQRNASRLTAYEVATDHVIRQFLLPLQLKVTGHECQACLAGFGAFVVCLCCPYIIRAIDGSSPWPQTYRGLVFPSAVSTYALQH